MNGALDRSCLCALSCKNDEQHCGGVWLADAVQVHPPHPATNTCLSLKARVTFEFNNTSVSH